MVFSQMLFEILEAQHKDDLLLSLVHTSFDSPFQGHRRAWSNDEDDIFPFRMWVESQSICSSCSKETQAQHCSLYVPSPFCWQCSPCGFFLLSRLFAFKWCCTSTPSLFHYSIAHPPLMTFSNTLLLRRLFCGLGLVFLFFLFLITVLSHGKFKLLSQGKTSCDSRATPPTVHAGCFSVSIIHQTLTWTAESLTCVQM